MDKNQFNIEKLNGDDIKSENHFNFSDATDVSERNKVPKKDYSALRESVLKEFYDHIAANKIQAAHQDTPKSAVSAAEVKSAAIPLSPQPAPQTAAVTSAQVFKRYSEQPVPASVQPQAQPAASAQSSAAEDPDEPMKSEDEKADRIDELLNELRDMLAKKSKTDNSEILRRLEIHSSQIMANLKLAIDRAVDEQNALINEFKASFKE